MTEVYLKLNKKTDRYDCYTVMEDKYIQTLTCGNSFILIADDEDLEVSGRIEHHSTNGYYWIDSKDEKVVYLKNGINGYI